MWIGDMNGWTMFVFPLVVLSCFSEKSISSFWKIGECNIFIGRYMLSNVECNEEQKIYMTCLEETLSTKMQLQKKKKKKKIIDGGVLIIIEL